MNRVKYLLFAFFLGFIFIDGVFAIDINLSKKTNDFIVGDKAIIKVELNIDQEGIIIDSCNVKISFDDLISLGEVQALNSWTITNKNVLDGTLDLSIKNYQRNLYGIVNLVNLTYLVNGDGNVKIDSAVCYNESGASIGEINVDNSNMAITTVVPKDNLLKSLKINGQELNPMFSPNINSYSISNFNANSLSLSYELFNEAHQDDVEVFVNDNLITDLGNIPYELSFDNNVMLITVQVSNVSKYNIFIGKNNQSLNNHYLSSITINGDELELVPGKFDYEYTVSDDVKTVEVLSTVSDEAKFQLGSSSNAPNTFNVNGKVVAVLNVVPINEPKNVPSVTYTVTIANQSYNGDVNNPNTSDTSMYIVLGMLILSLVGSTVLYQKNLNGYK